MLCLNQKLCRYSQKHLWWVLSQPPVLLFCWWWEQRSSDHTAGSWGGSFDKLPRPPGSLIREEGTQLSVQLWKLASISFWKQCRRIGSESGRFYDQASGESELFVSCRNCRIEASLRFSAALIRLNCDETFKSFVAKMCWFLCWRTGLFVVDYTYCFIIWVTKTNTTHLIYLYLNIWQIQN